MADTNPVPGTPDSLGNSAAVPAAGDDGSPTSNSAPFQGAVESDAQKLQEIRDAEVLRAAEMGKKQREREAKVKERVKGRKAGDAARSREAQNIMEAEKGAYAETKKGFRSMTKTRNKELEEYKKKQEAEKKWYDDQRKMHQEKAKKEKAYMGELNELSRVKIARQHAIDMLKAELIRARQKAEYDYRAAVDEAGHKAVQRKSQLEDDIRQKKILIDTDVKTKLYQLEGAKRSRNTGLDIELRQQLQMFNGKSPMEMQRGKIQAETQFKNKQRKVESEFNEKKMMIEQAGLRSKADADRELHTTESQIELDQRHAVVAAEQKRSTVLGELEETFEREVRQKKVQQM